LDLLGTPLFQVCGNCDRARLVSIDDYNVLFNSGCFGGFAQCIIVVPSDLIKCKMQVNESGGGGLHPSKPMSGALDCCRQVLKQDGVMGMFRGFGATAAREVPAFGIYFASYSNLVSVLSPNQPPSAASILFSGRAGTLSSSSCT
jgi:hypothetical protein